MLNARTQIRGRLRRLFREEGGTQLVELAIVLPVLIAMFAATAEFGRYFYTYSTLAKATRSGARYLTTVPVKGGANATEDAKVKQLVVYGDPAAAAGSAPLAPGLSAGNVKITRSGGTTSIPATVKVEITGYSYTPLINLGKVGGGPSWLNVPVKPSTTMRYMLTQPSI